MPNIASLLKDEITRIARKTLRAETESLKKASTHYRSEIAALKRRIADLERQLSRIGKVAPKRDGGLPTNERKLRFSAKGLQASRKRLDLSAADFGKLLGVSTQTVYNWEAGATRPPGNQIAAIAALRGVGKREARAKLGAAA